MRANPLDKYEPYWYLRWTWGGRVRWEDALRYRKKLTAAEVAYMLKDYRAGEKFEHICAKYCVNGSTLTRVLKKMGVSTRGRGRSQKSFGSKVP